MLSEIRDVIRYLSERGLLTIVTLAERPDQLGLEDVPLDRLDISESVDVTIDLQYVEAGAELAKGISVVKRRDGDHQKGMRELLIGTQGLRVGRALSRHGGRPDDDRGLTSTVPDAFRGDGDGTDGG